MSTKTPANGLRLVPRITVETVQAELMSFKGETNERLAKLETKADITIDLLREDREARNMALAEAQKTERVRLNGRVKVIVALLTTVGAVVGAGAAITMGGCV